MSFLERAIHIVAMVVVALLLGGNILLSKVVGEDGMSFKIMVAYRWIFSAAFLGPVAFVVEWKRRPNITYPFLLQTFMSGLLGGSVFCNLYYASMELTSPVFVSAIDNLAPAMTIGIAVLLRSEKLSLHRVSGKSKVLGTIICVIGAMVMTFYKGRKVPIWSSKMHLMHHTTATGTKKLASGSASLGIILAMMSCLSYALWMVLLEKLGNDYPCHYTSAAWMSLMGSIQSTIFAVCFERGSNQWKLGWSVRLFAVLYMGALGSGVVVILMTWCSQKRGPLFVSVFNPVTLLFVALASAMLLNEALYVGSFLGGGLIIIGLYLVLWGKEKEQRAAKQSNPKETQHDIEGNLNVEKDIITSEGVVLFVESNVTSVSQKGS